MRCLVFNKTQHAATYCILAGPCWLPALLAFGFGWSLAFLRAEFLVLPLLRGGWAVPCRWRQLKSGPAYSGFSPGLQTLNRAASHCPLVPVSDWEKGWPCGGFVRLLGQRMLERLPHQLRVHRCFFLWCLCKWEVLKSFANDGYKPAGVEATWPPVADSILEDNDPCMGRVPKKGLTSVAGSRGQSCGQTQASCGGVRKGALHASLAPNSSQNPGNLGKSQPILKNLGVILLLWWNIF